MRIDPSKLLKQVKNMAVSSLSILLFFLLWQLASSTGLLNDSIIPQAIDVIKEIGRRLIDGVYLTHTLLTLKRAAIGFLYALIIGITAGFLLGGKFKTLAKLLMPLFKLLEKLNPFALFPVFMMLFGIGETCKEVLVFWVCVWPVLFYTILGVEGVDRLMIRSAKTMGAKGGRLFLKVILPATTPDIFTGIKLSAQWAFFMIISGEIMGSSAGLGWFIWTSQIKYQIISLYGATIYVAILGVIINKLFRKLESRFLPWKQKAFEIAD
ncbi:ABC transporter permease [Clostridium aminobutyricum]|uniref:ABC transporter permease n=1 Tax=Clostridium aminobutyricum TaxID=33953 RepID=A0A939D8Z3_CLOAM|nr:ABC transporter permease [Clostridium aminobutyricum]MBN7773346.1 ABC transporter permease [Clostridium aminobutyricum]